MADEDTGVDVGGDDFGGFTDDALLDELEATEGDGSEDQQTLDAKTVSRESRALKFIVGNHPECKLDYIETVLTKLPLSSYAPDHGSDQNHKSVPFVTQYERTKIIGFRANQLAQKAMPLIDVPKHVTDVVEIARMEFEQKRIPVILKRPMPDGTYEYWRLQDLMIL